MNENKETDKKSEDELTLEELKKNYELLKIKYNLPEFGELNKDFWIEKISETETDFILREIRKFITDRTTNYMRFLESMLNPSNASLFTFSFCKLLNSEEKKEIEELYKKLMKIELMIMDVDIIYSEEKEADFIKNSVKEWNDFKIKWKKIIEKVKTNWDKKSENGNNKCYFG
jgi:hypothetical protein